MARLIWIGSGLLGLLVGLGIAVSSAQPAAPEATPAEREIARWTDRAEIDRAQADQLRTEARLLRDRVLRQLLSQFGDNPTAAARRWPEFQSNLERAAAAGDVALKLERWRDAKLIGVTTLSRESHLALRDLQILSGTRSPVPLEVPWGTVDQPQTQPAAVGEGGE